MGLIVFFSLKMMKPETQSLISLLQVLQPTNGSVGIRTQPHPTPTLVLLSEKPAGPQITDLGIAWAAFEKCKFPGSTKDLLTPNL